ncbi:hypothetical protein VP01_2412g4 [Puccinia sorghi]|uniref:Tet-like 2OG-Fe(II) oxygenase domain-containing protein n=1 Tax=Puccinia sorghi TaxID=27349 RepID=A0A0L6V6R9_9BASI|nr:hypothetical protein VP01_2412g4 [Puccinia sorghi]
MSTEEISQMSEDKFWKEKSLKANLNLSGVAHIHSFIFWPYESWKNIIDVVKSYTFATMNPSLKSQYQHLSHSCIAQYTYQNLYQSNGPQYSGNIYSLGWKKGYKISSKIDTTDIAAIPTFQPKSHCSIYLSKSKSGYEISSKIGTTGIAEKVAKDQKGYRQLQTLPEQNTFIGKQFYSVSVPLFKQFKQQHNSLNAPLLEPKFKEYPKVFTFHLSFTISNFSNLPHKEDDASLFTLVMWIPIEKTTDDLCGINFSGFNSIVECAWKVTAYSHLTLPSCNPSNSLHTYMGLSCHLPKKTQSS